MAFRVAKANTPSYWEKFLGVNQDDSGGTALEKGEAETMLNCSVNESYDLTKRDGYKLLFEDLDTVGHPIRGLWEGFLNDEEILIYVANGKK